MKGPKFYHIRKFLGYNQEQLANELEISLYLLRQYENDEKTISSGVKHKMEKHLKKFQGWFPEGIWE